MQNKTVYAGLISFCYILVTCNNDKSNHKGGPPAPKSSTPIVASVETTAKGSTIAANLMNDSAYTTFAQALRSTGLMEMLTKPGPFTLFAPTNHAFSKLPEGTLESWMKTRKKEFANIMSYHIVAGAIKMNTTKRNEKLKTVAGEELILALRDKKTSVNGIKIIYPHIEANNGIIYGIDEILFPKDENITSY
jgi:uncharacterized surface protein with fasciclin (FAS1) repeats